jgi:hypothetical protein
MKWALNNFEDWADPPCPDKLLLVDDAQVLSHWFQKFVLSTRKKSGAKPDVLPRYFQQPCCSFSVTVMNSCTFNVIQGPQQTLSP